MIYTIDQLQKIQTQFTRELTASSQGQTTSLPFIVHPLGTMPLVGLNERFQVLVIGGTIYKSALLIKNETGIHIEKQESGPLPLFDTKERFLSFIAPYIDPNISVLGLNFAYQMMPQCIDNKMEGILTGAGKEQVFAGLMGERVGQSIENHQKAMGHTIRVSVANDTICLLLSGLTKYEKKQIAAGIVGSGLNFAIFLGDRAAVNIESAQFNTFEQSREAKIIDQRSQKPGNALFEKETAGVYVYQLYNVQTNGTVRSTEELSDLAGKGNAVAQEFITRSAQLVSCQIAGIANYYGHDTTFVMEGSLFWKGWKYTETVEQTVRQLTNHRVSFVHISDSGILGAAKLIA